MSRLTLISRAGCHLCEVAEQTLDRIGEPWDKVEVEEDRLRRDLARPPGAPRW